MLKFKYDKYKMFNFNNVNNKDKDIRKIILPLDLIVNGLS